MKEILVEDEAATSQNLKTKAEQVNERYTVKPLRCDEMGITESDVQEQTDREVLKDWMLKVQKLKTMAQDDARVARETYKATKLPSWVVKAESKAHALGVLVTCIAMRLGRLAKEAKEQKQKEIAAHRANKAERLKEKEATERIREHVFIDVCRNSMDKEHYMAIWNSVDLIMAASSQTQN